MSAKRDLPDANSSTVTERIEATAFEVLDKHPQGLGWADLKTRIEESDTGFHPKTVNGCVWKLVERYPDRSIELPTSCSDPASSSPTERLVLP